MSDTSEQVSDPEQIRAAVLACPGVADLFAGAFGEIASYLPGRKIAGVRVDDELVEVHVVADYGPPLIDLADEIARRVEDVRRGRRLVISIDDIVLPGESLAADSIG